MPETVILRGDFRLPRANAIRGAASVFLLCELRRPVCLDPNCNLTHVQVEASFPHLKLCEMNMRSRVLDQAHTPSHATG